MSFIAVAIGGAALIGGATSLVAGSTQAGAAQQGQQLQAQEQQNALNFQEQEWQQQQANEAPWLKAGAGAVQNMSQLANGGLPAWNQQFQAPTAAQAAQYPGYQFQQQQGIGAMQNSAAASGGLLTGNTGEALQQYGQGLAQSDYTNVYNQAMQEYQQSYNQYQTNQANQFNRQASIAGLGQTAAGQLGQEGQSAASNVGNISLTGGAQQAQALNNAAAANASGYVGAGNAASSGLTSLAYAPYLKAALSGLGG